MGRWQSGFAALALAAMLLTSCGGRAAQVASAATRAVLVTASTTTSAKLAASTTTRIPTTATATTTTVAQTPSATTSMVSTAETTTTTSTQAVLPVRLEIPRIDVSAPVELVGLTADGAMAVPQHWNDVGWYEYGPLPGEPGNAAIAGHLDSTTAPAVFWRLGTLRPGDVVKVSLSNGQTVEFKVTEIVSYPYNNAPLMKIFGPAKTANLNLITCGGRWDPYTKNYSNRIVVYTTRV